MESILAYSGAFGGYIYYGWKRRDPGIGNIASFKRADLIKM